MSELPPRYHKLAGPLDGGMAEVYKAYDLRNEFGEVAVKLLPRGTARRGTTYYDRERRALERLRHPNIVELLESGELPRTRQLYLVFPWLPARLQEAMAAQGAMLWEDWWEQFGKPILGALELAHREDVEHRDLKPANILLTEDAVPKVIDFGISKIYSLLQPEATVDAASAPFTPPEPVAESPRFTRDTHAWAALTVFALSGLDPYSATTSNPFDLLSEALAIAKARMPAPLREILNSCLSRIGTERPQNAMVLAAKLDVALEQAARTSSRQQRLAGPAVPVVFKPALLDALELDLDLFSADLRDLLERELDGPVTVLDRGEGRYTLVCASLSIRTAVHLESRALLALGAVALSASTLDRDRERGWSADLRFALGPPSDPDIAQDALRELQQRVAEDSQRRRAAKVDERARPLVVWRGLLALLRAHEASEEAPREYDNVAPHPRGIQVHLVRPSDPELLGESVVLPGEGGRDAFGVVVEVRRRNLTIALDRRGARIPQRGGTLRLDRRRSVTAIERQQRALDAIEYGRAARPDLADLLVAPNNVRKPEPVDVAQFCQSLDDSKKDAVRAALGSPDLLIVRGPPGTGKTTFITELVIQEVRRNPAVRILVASQSHAALDHALAGIRAERQGIALLRVARPDDERVASSSRPLLLDARLAEWKRRAVEKGQRTLRKWAETEGVDLERIEAATRLVAVAAGLRQRTRLENRRAALTDELEEMRRSGMQASQSSTASQVVRDRLDELDDIRLEHALCGDQIREERDRLVELGQLRRRTSRSSLSPNALESQAAALLPDESPVYADARRRLRLLADWHARFGLGPAFHAAMLARSQVVAATCVGLGGLRGAETVEWDLVIVDEASKATAPELLIPMARGKRWVLVGDEHQLPPYVEDEALDAQQIEERGLTLEELTTPMFNQLRTGAPDTNVVSLTHQHRMNPAIGRLVSYCFYDRELTSEPRPPVAWITPIAPRPVTWLTTTPYDDRTERKIGSSFINPLEIRAIARFLHSAERLARSARVRPRIAVLTGYASQRDALEQRLARDRPRWRAISVECQTVDAFQGQQADIVVYSLTRSNRRRKLGFVKERPRVNVALSRGRDVLVIVGDHAFARSARGSAAMRRVLDHIDGYPDECVITKAALR